METPPDPDAGCGVVLPDPATAAQRASCSFGPGASIASTLGVTPAQARGIPIRHVIVMMKENRSFDHLLGTVQAPDEVAAMRANTNLDLDGGTVTMSHATTTCWPWDPEHQYTSMTYAVNQGAMDGFVKNAARTTPTDGHFVMSYYDETDLPLYHFLARNYALADRHFAPVQSGTFADRNFILFGHNAGAVDTGIVYPEPNTPSLLHQLMNAGYTWGAYSDELPFSAALGWTAQEPGAHTMEEFFTALADGKLPNVAFIDATENVTDDHPTADLQKGEAWVKRVYDAARASPEWERLALIWTYDEGGGFPDHVPPPAACQAIPGSPFLQYGVRVPLVAISPWAKRGHVSHQVRDHTAITRFVATLFDLPALTARDANSDDLLDLFDFSCGRDLSTPEAPDGGTGGCANPP
jgi:phospholipase C